MLGGAFGLLFHQIAPSIVPQPGAFVFVGMAAFYAGIAKVPLATIILVSELFGSYDLLVPLMFTEMITVLLLRKLAMYPEQVRNRLNSPAHVADFTIDVLQDLFVRNHFTSGRGKATLPAAMNLRDFLEHVSSTADTFFVVRNPDGKLAGIVSLSNVRSVVSDPDFLEHMLVSDAMWPLLSVTPDTDLRNALLVFLESGYDHLPVIDPKNPDEPLGMLTQQQVFAAYNAELVRRKLDETMPAGAAATTSALP
jgi:CIC family chloride channel protein